MEGDTIYGELDVLKPLLHPSEAATVFSGLWALAIGLFSGLAGVDPDKILVPFLGAIAIGWIGHYFLVRHFVRQHYRLQEKRNELKEQGFSIQKTNLARDGDGRGSL